jgi:hypothetical protein
MNHDPAIDAMAIDQKLRPRSIASSARSVSGATPPLRVVAASGLLP